MNNFKNFGIIFSNLIILFGVFSLNWSPVESILFIWTELFIFFILTSIKLKTSKIDITKVTFLGYTIPKKENAIDGFIGSSFGILLLSLVAMVAPNIYDFEFRSILTPSFFMSVVLVLAVNIVNFILQKKNIMNLQSELDSMFVKSSVLLIALIYTSSVGSFLYRSSVEIELHHIEILILVIVKTIAELNGSLYRKIFFLDGSGRNSS